MATFRECIQSIGTQFDSGKNRREIRRLRSVIKKKIEESEQKLKETHGRSAVLGERCSVKRSESNRIACAFSQVCRSREGAS